MLLLRNIIKYPLAAFDIIIPVHLDTKVEEKEKKGKFVFSYPKRNEEEEAERKKRKMFVWHKLVLDHSANTYMHAQAHTHIHTLFHLNF